MCQIDDAKNIHRAERGLVEQIFKAHENVRCLKPMIIHCITHQRVHCGKILESVICY